MKNNILSVVDKVLDEDYVSLVSNIYYGIYFATINGNSGLDSKYESSGSIIDAILSSASSLLSTILLIKSNPGDKDYNENHIILSVICIIVFYIVTNVYIFKLKKDIENSKKKVFNILGITLIPTLIFSLLCLLTKLQLILYIFILIIYIIILKTIINKKIKNNLKKKISDVKEIDKSFNEKEFNTLSFNLYKEIQYAWCSYKIYKTKDIISEEIYSNYKEKIDKLKLDKQKNVMDKIELKSNKIVDIKIENNIEIIECEMNATCYDYIIDDKDKVVKGKKDKVQKYSYKLVFNKDLNTNKYVLVEKKILKEK